jgi:hypothetical protein
VVGHNYTAELKGQSLFNESGEQFLPEHSAVPCPVLESVVRNGTEKSEVILFLKVSDGFSQRVSTKCRQISDNTTDTRDKDVCSFIKCH